MKSQIGNIYMEIKYAPIIYKSFNTEYNINDSIECKIKTNLCDEFYTSIICKKYNIYGLAYDNKASKIFKIIFLKPFVYSPKREKKIYLQLRVENKYLKEIEIKLKYINLISIDCDHDLEYDVLYGFYIETYDINKYNIELYDYMRLYYTDANKRSNIDIITYSEYNKFKLLEFPLLIIKIILQYLDRDELLSFRLICKKAKTLVTKSNIHIKNKLLLDNNSMMKYGMFMYIDIQNENFKNYMKNSDNYPKINISIIWICFTDINFITNIKYITKIDLSNYQFHMNICISKLLRKLLKTEIKNTLNSISLSITEINDIISLEKFNNITTINLNFNYPDKYMDTETFNYLIKSKLCDKIKSLYIIHRYINNDDHNNYNLLFEKCINLRKLICNNNIINKQTSLNYFYIILESLDKLKILNLYDFNDIPISIYKNKTCLEYLNVNGINIKILHMCYNLKQLSVDNLDLTYFDENFDDIDLVDYIYHKFKNIRFILNNNILVEDFRILTRI